MNNIYYLLRFSCHRQKIVEIITFEPESYHLIVIYSVIDTKKEDRILVWHFFDGSTVIATNS